MTINGTSGNDHKSGHGGPDDFDMSQGGNDTVHGRGGDDTFYFGAEFDEHDNVVGAAGNDALSLQGNYTAGVTFSSQNFSGVEQLTLLGAFTYSLAFLDTAIAAGRTLNIDATTVSSANLVHIDAQQLVHGNIRFSGGDATATIFTGFGNDSITTGASADIIAPGAGHDIVHAGDGDDTIIFHAGELDAADRIYGGSASEDGATVELIGDYSAGVTLGAATLFHIHHVTLSNGNDYKLDFSKVDTGGFGQLTIDAGGLGPSSTLNFTAAGNGKTSMNIVGGAGDDTIVLCTASNNVNGNAGADTLVASASFDTFQFDQSWDSTGATYDTVRGFNTHQDFFRVDFTGTGDIDGFDGRVTHGTLRSGHFDHDLAAAIGTGELGAYYAVLFKADDGNLAGTWFLIVDGNGDAGYQGGASLGDMVVRLEDVKHFGDFGTGNFGTPG